MAFSDEGEFSGWKSAFQKLMDEMYRKEDQQTKLDLYERLEPLLKTQQLMAFQHYVRVPF